MSSRAALAYINDVFDAALDQEQIQPHLLEKQIKEVKAESTKTVAGFRLHDAEAEKAAIESRLNARRALIDQYRADRDNALGDLHKLGVAPLAILPVSAWLRLLKDAGLYRFTPDKNGRVGIDHHWIDSVKNEREANRLAREQPKRYLELLFPNQEGLKTNHNGYNTCCVTLMLPPPPTDVISTLLKAQKLQLHVAVVAEAIRFHETPGQLFKRQKALRDEEERIRKEHEEWLRKDPIVYAIFGTAAVVIAQFGDFPIEQQVVERVMNSEHLLVANPADVTVDYRVDHNIVDQGGGLRQVVMVDADTMLIDSAWWTGRRSRY